jgi:hypothetical protein|tara:strand:- start:3715 stop:4488 length:774 start_codon:yes stop_codon:yes gene_type:complete
MATGPKRGKRRPRPKKSKQNNSLLIQSLGAVIAFVLVIFLIAGGVLSTSIGAVVCMIILGVLFYSMSKPKARKRRRKRSRSKPQEKEPQFYTALPSTLGLSEIPEEIPTPQVKLPPRPIRAARRRRDFVTYPLAVGGGDYSDSYVQVDKDTILRLRSEMTPDATSLKLPGIRIGKFPSSKIASVMSKELESTPVEAVVAPVVGEAVVEAAVAMPVVGEAVVEVAEAIPIAGEVVPTPVVKPIPVEEEEEMDFDMEWD